VPVGTLLAWTVVWWFYREDFRRVLSVTERYPEWSHPLVRAGRVRSRLPRISIHNKRVTEATRWPGLRSTTGTCCNWYNTRVDGTSSSSWGLRRIPGSTGMVQRSWVGGWVRCANPLGGRTTSRVLGLPKTARG